MAHGEALQSAPTVETGARHVKVGRGGYSQTDVASCASVVRGPRRTIEVEEGTLPPLLPLTAPPTVSFPPLPSPYPPEPVAYGPAARRSNIIRSA